MGNKKSKKTSTVYDKIENLLIQTYKNTGIDFTENEIVNFKLRIMDSEKYFSSNFDYFIFFNNYLFKEQLAILYDNFNRIIETTNPNQEKPFTLLVDFDDESEYIMQGSKIEFDSLFTIIFEKLEIPTLIFFDMTNTDNGYIADFINQIIESVELYKYNRKFDCMYFLFPNTDYFIKNENCLHYMSNKSLKNKINYYSDDIFEIVNEYSDAVLINPQLEKFINCTYPKNISNSKFEILINQIKPTFVKTFISLDLNCCFENLESLNAENFEKIKFLLNLSETNCLVICFNYSLDCSNYEIFETVIVKNFYYIFKKLVYLFSKCSIGESILGIKFNLQIKSEDEIQELNKLSSRTYNFLNYNNNNNNFPNNSHREIKSARELKSKREKERIFNYFYDSQIKNFFEILTFEITTIINNVLNFPQFDDNNVNNINNKQEEGRDSKVVINHDNFANANHGLNNYNSTNILNNKSKNKSIKDKAASSNNSRANANAGNKSNNNNYNKDANENKEDGFNHKNRIDEKNAKIKNKPENISRKLNLEFNEITPVYNGITEIVKYNTDTNSCEVGGSAKIIKLDHNLHSEKLFFYWEKLDSKTLKSWPSFKKRNVEFKNLKNLINNSQKFAPLNEWNILLNLQSMFLRDYIKKNYKIEKSNINLQDYMQKIH